MFQPIAEHEADEKAEGGTRHLFTLGHFEFRDSLDGEGQLHHFVADSSEADVQVFETDPLTMYECMARFLAGEYEKREYAMQRSPAQDGLLDTLEIAAARARSGDTDFVFDDLEVAQELDEIEDDPADERP